MQPRFLSFAEALEIHRDQLQRYGGDPGIRDLALLKSALGTPAVTYSGQYLHTDLYEMAAAYLFHLVNNQPFVDGNKRVGAVAAMVFLMLNGYELTALQEALADMVLSVARGEASKTEVAAFVRRWAVVAK